MGKNNRQRRATKNRNRARQRGRRPPRSAPGRGHSTSDEGPDSVLDLFFAAVAACRAGDEEGRDALVDHLAAMATPTVALAIQASLEVEVSHLWDGGWQPADVDRLVRRELGGVEASVLRCVLAEGAVGYADLGARVAPGWMAQLDAVGAARWWDTRRHYLPQIDRHWATVVQAAVRVMHLLALLPELPTLTPPPSKWSDDSATSIPSTLSGGLLDKVRALLAKAESTSFDAEAEALTAKAQEIMTRHRIDRAMLSATERASDEAPVGRRVSVDDPYADAKAMLLDAIAKANGGRAVWSKHLGFSTVFGFAGELDAIEELFTSLLVQSSAALQREGSKQDLHGRSRTKRFRRSFLVAFATRIGERLRETVDATVTAAQDRTGEALLPVLALRDDAVEEATARMFPQLDGFRPRATDVEGLFAGRLFGSQADIGVGPELAQRSA